MSPQLIETLRVEGSGSMPLLTRHLARLRASSQALGYGYSESRVAGALHAHCADLSRGVAQRLRLLLDCHGQLSLTSAPLAALPAQPSVGLARVRLHSDTTWLRHKTTHRPWFDAATAWLAQHPDYFDLIFFNEHGELCEGSRSNVYVLLNEHWYTPPLACGLLPGVARAQILASGQARERRVTRAELAGAQGLRLSNALRGWFDVTLRDTHLA